jgi:hypothetical protein
MTYLVGKKKRGAGGSRTHGGGFAIYQQPIENAEKEAIFVSVDTEFDTRLLAIIKSWPNLVEPIRRAMLALIERS